MHWYAAGYYCRKCSVDRSFTGHPCETFTMSLLRHSIRQIGQEIEPGKVTGSLFTHYEVSMQQSRQILLSNCVSCYLEDKLRP